MAQMLSITEIRYLQYLVQYSLNLRFCIPFLVFQGTKQSRICISINQIPACLLWFTIIQLKMATSLSSSSYTAPHHLVKSIFCWRLRGFCSHHHLDRQVSSAGEAVEHGLSRTSQSCAMRKKGVTTHTNRKHCLYPYAVQSCWLLLTELLLIPLQICTATYSTGKIVERNLPCCLLAYHSFPFSWISGSDSHMIHLCSATSCFSLKRRQSVWLLQLPSPDLPLVLHTCASSSHLEHAHAPIQTHSNYQKFWRVIAFSPNVESCTVDWKKTTFITTGLASMGWGAELLPSTGNNLDASKRPGIKGLFFF